MVCGGSIDDRRRVRCLGLLPLVLLTLGAKPTGLPEASVRPVWSVDAGPEAGARAMAVSGDRVLVVSWDGHLLGLDAATGRRAWRHEAPKSSVDGPWLAVSGGVAVLGRAGL